MNELQKKSSLFQKKVTPAQPKKQVKVIIKSGEEEVVHYYGQDEIDHIAQEIGFDQECDKSKYSWFLKQCLLTELPPGWEKEYDDNGDTLFYNNETKVTTFKHPLRHYFRKLFLKVLKLEQAHHTSSNKVEIIIDAKYKQTLLKQALEREENEAKRRKDKAKAMMGTLSIDFFQRNLKKKDESDNKKTKTLNIIGKDQNQRSDFHQLMAKIISLKSQSKSYYDIRSQIDPNDLRLLRELEKETLDYYERTFGNFIKERKYIENFMMKQIDLLQIYKLCELYGIDVLKESYLLWLPQYLMCLPLPPNWTEKNNENEKIYINMLKQITITYHPVEPFAKIMVEKARQYYNEKSEMLQEIKNKLKVHDKLLRTFMLNMNQVRLYHVQQQRMQLNIEKGLIQPTGEVKPQNDAELQEPGFKSLKHELKNKRQMMMTKQRDLELFTIAKQCNLDLDKDIHLLSVISDLLEYINRKTEDEWTFRYINDY